MIKTTIYLSILFVFITTSCKKVGDKFPIGYYSCDASVSENDSEYIERTFKFKLLSTSDTELTLEYYILNVFGDTLFDDVSLLDVSEKKNVNGSLKARLDGDEPIILSQGEIRRQGKNNYIIEGLIEYRIWFDGGDSNYWRNYSGTFVFGRDL